MQKLLIVISLVLILASCYQLGKSVQKDLALQEIQNKCIAKKVALGIKRKDISRTETGCIVNYNR